MNPPSYCRDRGRVVEVVRKTERGGGAGEQSEATVARREARASTSRHKGVRG